MKTLNIGIVGLDTSHAPAFAKLLNDATNEFHVPGGRVVRAYPGGSKAFSMSMSRVGQFTDEFRADVVRLCQTGGESVPEVARRLDLTESAIRGWVKKAAQEALDGGDTPVLTTSEQEELQRLRRDNRTLEMECEIPRRAAAFLARESQ